MEFKTPLLVVTDLERAKEFYRTVLGLEVILDFGANVTLTGGVALQTQETWEQFLGVSPDAIAFGGQDAELYFEEAEFDDFAARLKALPEVELVHPVQEHAWGQRAVRFFDPDHHVIEVGESIAQVCRRFLDSGMTPEQAAQRMDVPVEYVRWELQN